MPNVVCNHYNRAKFKITCDDLGLANLIVRSRKDLTVTVVDLEWTYIAAAQLFREAPRWLFIDHPTKQI